MPPPKEEVLRLFREIDVDKVSTPISYATSLY
jgi:hypothetical protein